jgi:hypothetical protein
MRKAAIPSPETASAAMQHTSKSAADQLIMPYFEARSVNRHGTWRFEGTHARFAKI